MRSITVKYGVLRIGVWPPPASILNIPATNRRVARLDSLNHLRIGKVSSLPAAAYMKVFTPTASRRFAVRRISSRADVSSSATARRQHGWHRRVDRRRAHGPAPQAARALLRLAHRVYPRRHFWSVRCCWCSCSARGPSQRARREARRTWYHIMQL